MAVLKRTCHDPHRPAWQVNAEIPSVLSAIIDRLLAKKPNERFVNAIELKVALEGALSDFQQGKLRPGQRFQKAWWSWAIAGMIGAMAFGLMWGIAMLWNGANMPAKKADKSAANQEKALADSSPRAQLEMIDPSSPAKAHEELDSLMQELNELESSAFPFEKP